MHFPLKVISNSFPCSVIKILRSTHIFIKGPRGWVFTIYRGVYFSEGFLMIWGKNGKIRRQSYLYFLRKNLFIFTKQTVSKSFFAPRKHIKIREKKDFSNDFLRKSFFLIYTEPLQTLMTSSALLAATSLAACTAILLASTAYT